MRKNLFIAGVPATGKSWLGSWLEAEHGYFHIDAEKDDGKDFDRAGVHAEWNTLIATGRATSFLIALEKLGKPIILDWGFPTQFLYVVNALRTEGLDAWWLKAERELARTAFVARGGIDPHYFDKQMNDIEREWSLIQLVFNDHILSALRDDGTQRRPEDLWSEMTNPSNQRLQRTRR